MESNCFEVSTYRQQYIWPEVPPGIVLKRQGDHHPDSHRAIQNNCEALPKLVAHDGSRLHYVLSSLKGYYEVVLTAVQQNGYSIQFASEQLKDQRTIVLEALKQVGRPLGDISKS